MQFVYADEALVPDNPTCAASISWDPDDDYCRPYYNYDNLTDRFLKYRVYWNPDSILFSVIDNEIEHFLFTDVFNIDSVSDEFHSPFYFVSNLALSRCFGWKFYRCLFFGRSREWFTNLIAVSS